jgi:anti-sigma regulatory factor (Ser/Thr protein kinase)
LRKWLTQAKLNPEQAMDVLVAAGEAVTNAIEHGHRDRPEGTISLSATALVDQVRLIIADTGEWKPPDLVADSTRGRGILMMRTLMQDVTINPETAGTTVHLSARIT